MAKQGSSGTMQVLLNERLVGGLRLAGSIAMSFTYDREWSAWDHAMPISLSRLLAWIRIPRRAKERKSLRFSG